MRDLGFIFSTMSIVKFAREYRTWFESRKILGLVWFYLLDMLSLKVLILSILFLNLSNPRCLGLGPGYLKSLKCSNDHYMASHYHIPDVPRDGADYWIPQAHWPIFLDDVDAGWCWRPSCSVWEQVGGSMLRLCMELS